MPKAEMTIEAKNAAISAAILVRVLDGTDIRDAMDAVLGAGTYERIAGEIYDALRAKARAA